MSVQGQIIGTVIGKTAGYMLQGYVFAKVANVVSPEGAIVLRMGTKYGLKVVNHVAKNYARTNFSSEAIFADAIDASFFAD